MLIKILMQEQKLQNHNRYDLYKRSKSNFSHLTNVHLCLLVSSCSSVHRHRHFGLTESAIEAVAQPTAADGIFIDVRGGVTVYQQYQVAMWAISMNCVLISY